MSQAEILSNSSEPQKVQECLLRKGNRGEPLSQAEKHATVEWNGLPCNKQAQQLCARTACAREPSSARNTLSGHLSQHCGTPGSGWPPSCPSRGLLYQAHLLLAQPQSTGKDCSDTAWVSGTTWKTPCPLDEARGTLPCMSGTGN